MPAGRLDLPSHHLHPISLPLVGKTLPSWSPVQYRLVRTICILQVPLLSRNDNECFYKDKRQCILIDDYSGIRYASLQTASTAQKSREWSP